MSSFHEALSTSSAHNRKLIISPQHDLLLPEKGKQRELKLGSEYLWPISTLHQSHQHLQAGDESEVIARQPFCAYISTRIPFEDSTKSVENLSFPSPAESFSPSQVRKHVLMEGNSHLWCIDEWYVCHYRALIKMKSYKSEQRSRQTASDGFNPSIRAASSWLVWKFRERRLHWLRKVINSANFRLGKMDTTLAPTSICSFHHEAKWLFRWKTNKENIISFLDV